MAAQTRSDAMWWASSSDDPKTEVTHPTALRKAHREALAEHPPSPDLTLEAPGNLTASMGTAAACTLPRAARVRSARAPGCSAWEREPGAGDEPGPPQRSGAGRITAC